MNAEPLGRHLILAECEDPRQAPNTPILTPDLVGTLIFAMVIAVDETPYQLREGELAPLRTIEVGDICYFSPESMRTYIDDDNQGRFVVHEGQVLMRVRGSAVNLRDADPTKRAKRVPRAAIMVPQSTLVN